MEISGLECLQISINNSQPDSSFCVAYACNIANACLQAQTRWLWQCFCWLSWLLFPDFIINIRNKEWVGVENNKRQGDISITVKVVFGITLPALTAFVAHFSQWIFILDLLVSHLNMFITQAVHLSTHH